MTSMTLWLRPFLFAMSDWEKLRYRAFRRDGFMCRECSRYGLHVAAERAHHVWPEDEYPEYSRELWNILSLCKPCHDRMHERGSRRLTALGLWWLRRTRPPF